jgi:hypothetical protein
MTYDVEVDSGTMIYIPSFIRIVSGIRDLIKGIHRQHSESARLFQFFFSQQGNRLRMEGMEEVIHPLHLRLILTVSS